MAEGLAKRRRVFVEDSRRNGLYLRTTWHREQRQFVVSTWQDEVCTGAVRVPVEQSAELLGLLADGLADAAASPVPAPAPAPLRWHERLRRWLGLLPRGRTSLTADDPASQPVPRSA